MAEVWSGTDEVLDRPVAIKLMDAGLLAIPPFRGRFREEARAAARLSHPRIVAIHDYGEAHLPGGAVLPYIVRGLADRADVGAAAARRPDALADGCARAPRRWRGAMRRAWGGIPCAKTLALQKVADEAFIVVVKVADVERGV